MGKLDRPEHWPDSLEGIYLRVHVGLARDARDEKEWFWIDTVCVPARDKKLEKRAVNRMAPIYAGVSRVIVLDSEIEQLQLERSDDNQILAQLACYSWMRRCWIFHEGALSRDCRLQCANGTVNPVAAAWENSRKARTFHYAQ
jgi:Heterokaryon incompatibility protein (HET)